jgi:hypothetical protein
MYSVMRTYMYTYMNIIQKKLAYGFASSSRIASPGFWLRTFSETLSNIWTDREREREREGERDRLIIMQHHTVYPPRQQVHVYTCNIISSVKHKIQSHATVLTKSRLFMVEHQSSTYFGWFSNRLDIILESSGLFPSP